MHDIIPEMETADRLRAENIDMERGQLMAQLRLYALAMDDWDEDKPGSLELKALWLGMPEKLKPELFAPERLKATKKILMEQMHSYGDLSSIAAMMRDRCAVMVRNIQILLEQEKANEPRN